MEENNENKRDQYIIGESIIVKKQEGFYSDGLDFKAKDILKRDLSNGMKRICEIVGSIAIDRLDHEKFIKFYNIDEVDDFLYADLTKLHHPKDTERGEIAGFLFSCFFSRKVDGKTVYVGKAFPALRFQDRTNKERNEFNRFELYKKFLGFHLAEIFGLLKVAVSAISPDNEMTQLQERINNNYKIAFEQGNKEILSDRQYMEDIKTVIKILHDKKFSISGGGDVDIPEMNLEVYIENPITYKDLCEYKFKYNIEQPTKEFTDMSNGWDVGDLLKESYLKSKGMDRHKSLVDGIDFSVNLTPMEWRQYFELSIRILPMRYYIWQNYNFPNSAFKAIIPLDAYNFWRVLRGKEKNSPFGDVFDKEIEDILKP